MPIGCVPTSFKPANAALLAAVLCRATTVFYRLTLTPTADHALLTVATSTEFAPYRAEAA